MNKPVIAGVAAGVLLAGIILGPIPGFFGAQAQEEENTGGNVKQVTLIASETDVQVAPDNALHPGGVMYRAMTFNGTIPGPVISVDQGDTIEFTLTNEGQVIHSIDFHAGFGPQAAVGSDASETGSNVQPGQSVTWTWSPPYAGVFYYHCGADGLNGVWEHIANGMYGGIVVHPPNEQPAKEFYVAFGEIYSTNVQGLFTAANGTGTLDLNKFLARNPDLVLTNGMAHKYVPSIGAFSKIDLNPDAQVFQVQPGELTRWYIVNGGPSDDVAFHFISGILSVHDGSIQNRYGTQVLNDETWNIPPGSASVVEAVFPSEGIYVGVDHAMDDVLKGAAFAVLATPDATPDDHPAGTMVPPRGSDMVSGPPMTTNATGATTGVNATELGPETAEGEGLPVTNVTGTENATETEGGATTGGTENITETGAAMSNATEGTEAAEGESLPVTNATGTETATETEGGATTGANGGGGTATGVSITTGSSSKTTDAFQPNPAQVSVGSTVTWTNEDAQPHTVNSGENATPDGTFDSGILAPAATYDFTFTEAGEYPYFCLLHPNMVGTVSVS
ncbi:MAG TPA: plastocyanin/azurin family copper-binding protein [Nitrososphaera sp.]|nr:plastocyanin/azurin family copper-binding protein [Nitrososphaera sp.]